MNAELSAPVERIVVALDASPQSVAALRAAAELAALLQADVEGLFVEDVDLLALCGLPFGCEVRSFTATVRRLDSAELERQLRVQAAQILALMERVVAQSQVHWSFRVLRGAVAEELLGAAQSAALMSLGRAGRSRRRGLGSITQTLVEQAELPLLISDEGQGLQYPLTVLYTGSGAARRALALALRLAGGLPGRVRVVLSAAAEAGCELGQLEDEARQLAAASLPGAAAGVALVRTAGTADLPALVRSLDGGTLVLPREQAALVAEYGGASLLVP